MSLPFTTTCAECLIQKNLAAVRQMGTEDQAMEFLMGLCKLLLEAPEYLSAPYLNTVAGELIQKIYQLEGDRYKEEKDASNRFVLERMDALRKRIRQAADPVYAGIQYSILGNYLDFAALQHNVSFEKLEEMLDGALNIAIEPEVYESLCHDLETGKNLLILTDNAGEIGFDRLMAEEIAEKYPHIAITFCVKGQITANDATREDAAAVGVPFPVIDNGNRIAGTQLEECGEECLEALKNADVILSKGMANTETLFGCGYNIYYAFMVKCPRFEKLFGKPLYTPMLVKERK